MGRRQYALGIDVGDATVVAAVCRTAEEPGCAAPPVLLPARPPADGAAPLGCRALRRVGGPGTTGAAGRTVAELVRQVVESATATEGAPPDRTVVTVPADWGGHRRALLEEALGDAGLAGTTLVPTALAAARHLLGRPPFVPGSTVAVQDVGAGWVDTAVVRAAPDGALELVAPPRPPQPWGGRDLDDVVVDLLLDRLDDEDGEGVVPPAELRRAAVAAKEALSADSSVRVELPGHRSLRLVREDVEELLDGAVPCLVDAVQRSAADAGVAPTDLAAVLLVGGTGRVPLVAETLSAGLAVPLVVDDDPAATAALGAAALAAELAEEPTAEPADGAAAPTPLPADPAADEPPAAERTGSTVRRRTPPARRAPRRPVTAPTRGPRSPAPVTGRGRRALTRVGVVTSAFVAATIGLATVVTMGVTGNSPEQSATAATQAAPTVAPEEGAGAASDGAPAAGQDRDGDRGGDGGAGSGPSARSGTSSAGAPSSTGPGTTTGTSTSRTTSGSATPGSSTPGSSTPAGAPGSTAGGGTAAGSTAPGSTAAGPVGSAGQPGVAQQSGDGTAPAPGTPSGPAPDQPPADPPPSSEPPADPPPAGEPPADPPPSGEPPADPAPSEPAPGDPAPSEPAAIQSSSPPPADPPAPESPAPELA